MVGLFIESVSTCWGGGGGGLSWNFGCSAGDFVLSLGMSWAVYLVALQFAVTIYFAAALCVCVCVCVCLFLLNTCSNH